MNNRKSLKALPRSDKIKENKKLETKQVGSRYRPSNENSNRK